MAIKVLLRHKETGVIKTGYYGFSWTTLFFGFMPALFRGDFRSFVGGFCVLLVLSVVTLGVGTGIAMVVWAFKYNAYYTRRLLERGYVLAGSDAENVVAASALRIALPAAA
jgi:hypothetical protein